MPLVHLVCWIFSSIRGDRCNECNEWANHQKFTPF